MLGPCRTAIYILFLLPAISAAESPSRIHDARLGIHDDRSRLVIESGRPVSARMQRQGLQIRLTLSGAETASLTEQLSDTSLQDLHGIESYRLDTSDPAHPALLLNLTHLIRAEAFALKPHDGRNHRIVLDLFNIPGSAPAAESEISRARPQLKDVRIGHGSERTRIVFETSAPVDFDMARGANSSELVLTLGDIDFATLNAAIARVMPTSRRLLLDLDARDGSAGTARLTLKLAPKTRANVFSLRPDHGFGYRLVVDLTAAPEHVEGDDAKPTPDVAEIDQPAETPDRTAPTAETEEWMWLEAALNQQQQRHTILVLRTVDGFYMNAEDLATWNLRVPERADLHKGGEDWFLLDAMGIEASYDARRLTLDLTAPAERFGGRTIQPLPEARLAPTPSTPGMLLNYDVSVQHGDDDTGGGALLELGAFGKLGTLTSNAVVQYHPGSDRRYITRLDTSWRRDDYAGRRSLVIGDTITHGPSWAGSVRFGGVRWGNNFELHPQLVTMPLLSMTGEAALPSTIELYVDDALRLRDSVDPGPFNIDQIPLITGSGQARLVVTDVLGRQRIITHDFYASPQQLRKGLRDWSLELGAVRENYGRRSFEYGQAMIAGSHRSGLSDTLTTTVHAQLTESHGAAGAGASWQLPVGGILSVDGALSRGDDADGWYTALALQRQGQRFFGGVQGQWASEDFTRLGMHDTRALPRQQVSATLSARRIFGGTLGLSYTGQKFRQRDDVELLTFRFSRRLPGASFLHVSAVRNLEDDGTAINVSFTLPLGDPRTTANLSLSRRGDRGHGSVRLRRSLPVGTGSGYDVHLRAGDGRFQRGSVAWQNEQGRWQLEAARRNGQVSGRAQAAGGLVWLAGDVFASRRLRESFAVVEVDDFPGIRVYADNQEVARTNANGKALIPGLRPYQRNRLRIDQADLPLGANVDGLERDIAPYWRSGVLASFPVHRTRDALFRVVLENGQPLPTGAVIHDENDQTWPVGRRGEAFITDLSEHNALRARHNGKQCSFELTVPPSDEPLLDLGTVVCKRTPP